MYITENVFISLRIEIVRSIQSQNLWCQDVLPRYLGFVSIEIFDIKLTSEWNYMHVWPRRQLGESSHSFGDIHR